MSSIPNHSHVGSPPSPPRSGSTLWQWLQHAAPTAAVVAALIGLAAFGHYTEWTLPKFGALVGNTASSTEVWCEDHNVAEAECIECQPDLLPVDPDHGWCQEHGISQCPFEHPEVVQLKSPPTITPEMRQRAAAALALRPRPENNSLCALHLKRIQFASLAAVEKVGLDISIAQERPIVEAIAANGEIGYDQTRLAHLPSRVAGTVRRVEKQIGDRVEKGDILALIDAAEIGRAKGEFLQAIAQRRLQQATLDRLIPLAKDGVIPERQFREAEAAVEEAKIRVLSARQSLANLGLPIEAEDFPSDADATEIAREIKFLGLPRASAQQLEASAGTSNLFPLRAPLAGIVVERHVVEGEVVDPATPLFAIADISHLWLTLDVKQEDARYVKPGQSVLFRSSHASDESEIAGAVAWISTAADDQTRTVKVRVDLPNPAGMLRANTFGTGRIVLRQEPAAVVVPSEALHWDGNCHIVFVRNKNYHEPTSPKFFHVRSVRPGVKQAGQTEIIAGLLPGEVIASKNSVVLEAQLLKSTLGAGCAHDH